MKIGITGATGQLGRLVVEALKRRVSPDQVVALVRSPDKAADLGVAARRADYAEPASLTDALSGVDVLLLISSSEVGQRRAQHQNVIDAARAAGVGRVAYTSILRATESPLGLADEHRATEQALAASGLPHTLLRNGWYTENHTAGIGAALAMGAVIGSAGDGRFSTASRADYAEAAAVVLTGEEHVGKAYELAGDQAYTLGEFAAELSKQTGKDIAYNDLPPDQFVAALTGAGFPGPLAQMLADSDRGAADGWLFDDRKQLSSLIGRPTTPLSAVIASAL